MKIIRYASLTIAVIGLLPGCQKSASALEKERQEAIVREAMVKMVDQGKAVEAAKRRPGVLSGYVYKPSEQHQAKPSQNPNNDDNKGAQ